MKQALQCRTVLATLATVLLAASLHAQAPKKPVPAPPKPAVKAPTPAVHAPAAAPHAAGASTATHSATTTAGATHGATTTSTTHSVTTTSPHGATTTSTTTRTTTTAGGTARGGIGGGAAGGRPANTAMAGHGTTPMGRPAPAGSHDLHSPKGDVRMRPGGRPMDVHDSRRGMDIHHNLGGGRRVFVNSGGRAMYYERGRPGYIGHPYMAHGYEFNRRTYYYNGRAYDRFYRPYGYHGFAMEVYAPVRYYPVGFYGWAYRPWVTPVPYAWGFGVAPWYGVYGAYFTPYPVYATPSLWLTDYMISQTLAAAYAANQAAAAANAQVAYAGPPLTPEIKEMVAAEVQRELALENAEATANAANQAPDPASSGIARLMSDGQPHVFVAGKEVDVVDPAGAECALTDGDVVQMVTPPGPQDTTANVVVLSSKGGLDCRRTATVAIPLDELQDMSNHMRETVDAGLQELQAKQGQGGLPAAPASALAAPQTAMVAQDVPPPDPNGVKELEAQAQQSETAEKDVLAAATPDGAAAPAADAGAAAPTADVSIAPGQSTDQVKAALGQPTRIVNLGTKTMYFYKDMKVTFVSGKVTNIE